MGRIRTIARRTFLISSAAIVGGVAFGTYMYQRDEKNPLLADLNEGEAAINPFVKITSDGVTLITPRADVGQGAFSIQAYMIAEELDIDPTTVNIEPGPPARAYYNGVVGGEGMPIKATSDSFGARMGRGASNVAGKLLGLQLTGGSSTVPDMFERLRTAGAVARETLKAAAAVQSGHDVAALKTENGAVILPDGNRLAYTELAANAAEVDPVEDVTLRDPSDWKYLGKEIQRTDIIAKSTGQQTYGIDMVIEGMVYATTRTNPIFGAGIKSYDASEAEGMRGVQKILPISGGIAVVADNTWRAFQAANAVDCEWSKGAFQGDMDAQYAKVAEAFTPDAQNSQFRDDGDIDAGLQNGDLIEAEYKLPYLAHAPLEPMSVMLKLEGDRMDIWTATQIPRFMQASVAKITGLDTENIHVHVLMAGGSFGRRLEDDYVRHAAEIAVQMPGVPIKMVWSREEDFAQSFPRPLALAKGRGSVAKGGVETMDLSFATPSVSASQFGRIDLPVGGPDMMIVAGAWDQPFAIPNYRVTGYKAAEMVPISSWRSVGSSGNGFVHESFFDELCHAAGVDPLAERLRLCDHDASRKVIEAVGEMSNWGNEMGPGQGRGLAFTLSFGVPCAQVIEVTDTDGGIRIDKVFVAADVGRVLDPVNFEAQVTGGVIFGLGHAMNCELTFEDGAPQQTNFHEYEAMRLYQTPEIMVKGLENGSRIKGIGEPGVPPAAPALANAIFAATGKRLREMPFNKHVDFV